MTLQEKIIVSAYTGYIMCDWSPVHKYIEDKMGRPVWTHELADENLLAALRERVKPDFIALCATEGAAGIETRGRCQGGAI